MQEFVQLSGRWQSHVLPFQTSNFLLPRVHHLSWTEIYSEWKAFIKSSNNEPVCQVQMPGCWGQSFKGTFSRQCQYAPLVTQYLKDEKFNIGFPGEYYLKLGNVVCACTKCAVKYLCCEIFMFPTVFFPLSLCGCVILIYFSDVVYIFNCSPLPGLFSCKLSIRTVKGFLPRLIDTPIPARSLTPSVSRSSCSSDNTALMFSFCNGKATCQITN